MAGIIWSSRANFHFRRAIAYIREHSGSNRLADKWATKLSTAARRLELLPESGSPVEDLDEDGLREVIVSPYRIIYEFDGTNCIIHAVAHTSRDLRNVLPEFSGDEP